MAYFVLQRPPKCWVINISNNDVRKHVYIIRILLYNLCSRESEKLYEAIHLGRTSLLLINVEKYVKMSQT